MNISPKFTHPTTICQTSPPPILIDYHCPPIITTTFAGITVAYSLPSSPVNIKELITAITDQHTLTDCYSICNYQSSSTSANYHNYYCIGWP